MDTIFIRSSNFVISILGQNDILTLFVSWYSQGKVTWHFSRDSAENVGAWYHPFMANKFSSVAQSCLTFSDPMDCSIPDFSVHHQLCKLAQTHAHRVSDAIQPSHPLLSPSTPALNLSQHQALFPMSQFFSLGGQSIGASASSSVLPMNIQDWFPLRWTGLISLLSKRLSRVFSSTTVRKHQFFSTRLSSWQIDGEKEKTLVSPLDSKEIKQVKPKGNQP